MGTMTLSKPAKSRDGHSAEKGRTKQRKVPLYLTPYLKARRRHPRGVRSLLWEDRRAQEVRFAAILASCPMDGLHVLDVGCGHGDLLTYLRAHGVFPARYTGIEAPGVVGRFARRPDHEGSRIIGADFVREPEVLEVGADVLVFSGSLNLLPSSQFYRTLRAAWAATGHWLVFNFLDSNALTGSRWLKWHRRVTVLAFAARHAKRVIVADTYEDGDCTVVMRKRPR
jgi:SAM-dependent methyltransferase